MTLTQDRVKELLDYNPETGILTWKIKRRGRAKVGDEAGTVNGAGYVKLSVDGKQYLAHRVIWLWLYGYLPENNVDHVNRVTTDNRECNLREVSQSCNIRNSQVSAINLSGIKGVRVDKHGFHAFIYNKGRQTHIKTSSDFIEAVSYRLAAEQCLEWEGCDSSSSAYLFMQDYIKREGPIT